MKKTIFLFFAIASLISCNSNKSTSNTETKPATAQISKMDMIAKWHVESIAGINTLKTNPSMNLDLVENKISGKGGCNNYSGAATRDGYNIQFKGIASTKMMCPNADIESAYFKALDKVRSFDIKGNILTFYDEKGSKLITYSKVSR